MKENKSPLQIAQETVKHVPSAKKQRICVPAPIGCGGPASKFKDVISEREYQISGLCQNCQDKIFG